MESQACHHLLIFPVVLRNYSRLITRISIQLSPLNLGTSPVLVPARKAPLCVYHRGHLPAATQSARTAGTNSQCRTWFSSVGPMVHSTICPSASSLPLTELLVAVSCCLHRCLPSSHMVWALAPTVCTLLSHTTACLCPSHHTTPACLSQCLDHRFLKNVFFFF